MIYLRNIRESGINHQMNLEIYQAMIPWFIDKKLNMDQQN